MTSTTQTLLAFALCVGACIELGACVEEEPAPPDAPTLAVNEGDPCNWTGASCIDDLEVLRCIDGYWTAQGCDGYCASLGSGVVSSGCDLEIGTSSPTQLCACEPPADGCYPGDDTYDCI